MILSSVASTMWQVAKRPHSYQITHAGNAIEVTYKDVKYLRLRVLPPEGRVAVSVPFYVPEEMVREFVEARTPWIHTAQQQVRMAQPVVEPLVDGGRARLWGRWHELRVIDADRAAAHLDGDTIVLEGRDTQSLARALEQLYRAELAAVIPALFEEWEPRIVKKASVVKLRRMTSRWGSCNTRTAAITLNVALAEHRPDLLEYVVVHELVHLWHRDHGAGFYALMDLRLPDWRSRRTALRLGA